MKKAVLSIDVEDWYHLDYFDRRKCDTSYSMLDGLDEYLEIIEKRKLPSSFFILGEIAKQRISFYSELVNSGYDIGSHGWNHERPLKMTIQDFKKDLDDSYEIMKIINPEKPFGYRAPCFSIDRDRLNLVEEKNFSYSSSRINFSSHPLYGSIDMEGYQLRDNFIHKKNDFFEFESSTIGILGKNLPICGGGYLRILPWKVMETLLKKYFKDNNFYFFYIHPFELSKKKLPRIPKSSFLTRKRFSIGHDSVAYKLEKLIDLLLLNGFEFTDFKNLKIHLSCPDH